MLYLWIKAAHVIFVIFSVAARRFYVYHQEFAPGSDEEKVNRARAQRRIIITPATAILVWLFGLTLAYQIQAWS